MTSQPIGSLYAALGLDSSQFDAGVKRAQTSLKGLSGFSLGRGMKSGLDEISTGMQGMASRAGVAGAALSGMGAIGLTAAAAMVGLAGAALKAREAMSFADELSDTAAKLAISTDALQEYRYAVHALGGEAGDADAALEGFAKAFGAAHAGLSKKAAKPFTALGLDPKDFDSTEEALDAVIEKISALGSTAEQAAVADKMGLSPMLVALRAGVGEIDRLRASAHDLGIVMDAELVKRAGEANDEFETVAKVVDVQLKSALVDLAPVLVNLLGLVGKLASGLNGAADALRSISGKSSDGLEKKALTLSKEIMIMKRSQLNGAGVSEKAIDSKIAELNSVQAEIVRRKAEAAPPPQAAGSLIDVSGTGSHKRDQSADAIASAEAQELQARTALTGNIERLSTLRMQEIDAETASANRRLREQAAQGDISKAAAETAVAMNNRAALARKELVTRETIEQLADRELKQREQIGGFQDRIAQISAGMAGAVEERNRIEAEALARQQTLERDRLKADLDAQVTREEMTATERDSLLAAQADLQVAQRLQQAREAQVAIAEDQTKRLEASLGVQIDQLGAQADLTRSSYERAKIELRILKVQQKIERAKAEELLRTAKPGSPEADAARLVLEGMGARHRAQLELAEREADLAHAFYEASGAVDDMAEAFRRGDWGRALSSLSSALSTAAGLLGSGSKAGSLAASMSTAAAAAAPYAAMSQAFSRAIGPMLGFDAKQQKASDTWGLLAGLVVGKSSNHAGIAQINGDNIQMVSSGKENQETTKAAKATAQAIIDAQKLLRDAGISLNRTVHAVDLGSRDPTRIVMSDGSEFRTGSVGDPQAAAEAALKAVLQGATYVSDAQKRLVDDMLAAGKGFDEITAGLQAYAQAQGIGQSIADEILRLTDPKGSDVAMLKRAQEEQRKAVKDAADQGYLTAEQFAAINAQLSQLEALQLDEVLKRYADAATAASDAADRVSAAQDALKAAYGAQADALKSTLDQFGSIATGLRRFDDSLKLQTASSPRAALAFAAAAFAAVSGRTDPESLGKLQEAGQAFIEAAKTGARDQTELARVQAQVRAATQAGASAAEHQVDIAQAQLDALTAQVSGLIELNKSVLTVAQAISQLKEALVGKAAATLGNPATSLSDAQAAQYLADNKDLKKNWDAGGVMRTLGPDLLSAAKGHYLRTGQFEIAARLRKFATGGSFKVGGFGAPDSKLASMALSPNEYVNVTRGDVMADMAGEIRALRGIVANQGPALSKIANATDQQHRLWQELSLGGVALRTTAA